MRFKLSVNDVFFYEDAAKRLERLGFKFLDAKAPAGILCRDLKDIMPEIEIKTLEELLEFQEEWGTIQLSGDNIIIYGRILN